MTRDDITRMAHEAAGFDGTTSLERPVVLYAAMSKDFLDKFAQLVADAEREKCRKELRQPIEQADKQDMTVSECTCKAADMLFGRCCKAVEQGPFILDRGCYERGCIAYDERDGDGVIMKQERVDETAKREHEPVAWLQPNGEIVVRTDYGGRLYYSEQNVYAAPPKRKWVGLTDEEICKCAGIDGGDTWIFETAYAIAAKLKEKNS